MSMTEQKERELGEENEDLRQRLLLTELLLRAVCQVNRSDLLELTARIAELEGRQNAKNPDNLSGLWN